MTSREDIIKKLAGKKYKPKSKSKSKSKHNDIKKSVNRNRNRNDDERDGYGNGSNNNNNNSNAKANGNGNGGDSGNGSHNNNNNRAVAGILVALISQDSNLLFKDQYGVPFANIFNEDHYEVVKIGSGRFKRYLGWLYYESEYKVANTDAINSAVQLLQGRAEYQGRTIPLSLRTAWHNNDIYYDMTNNKWQCIRISKNGWQIINNTAEPIFTRYNQVEQVEPDRNYENDIFNKFF